MGSVRIENDVHLPAKTGHNFEVARSHRLDFSPLLTAPRLVHLSGLTVDGFWNGFIRVCALKRALHYWPDAAVV
jgi:hypothetical protein